MLGFVSTFLLIFAADRAVRRRVHHRQHLPDARPAASARARDAAGGRRVAHPGVRLDPDAGGRRGPARRGRRCRRRPGPGLGAASRARPDGHGDVRPHPAGRVDGRRSRCSSARWSASSLPRSRPGGPRSPRRSRRCATTWWSTTARHRSGPRSVRCSLVGGAAARRARGPWHARGRRPGAGLSALPASCSARCWSAPTLVPAALRVLAAPAVWALRPLGGLARGQRRPATRSAPPARQAR